MKNNTTVFTLKPIAGALRASEFSVKILLVLSVAVFLLSYASSGSAQNRKGRSGELPPRKVVIGTVIHGYYGVPYPGLDQRLTEVEDLIVPLDLTEENGTSSNAAVLLDRTGKVAGIYRKVHLVAPLGSDILEDGHTPGAEYPVFDCDFGRIGIQICFDLCYPEGWKALADKGAEIVAVPTMSPQTVRPSAYALEGRYYVVTSNHRNNATVFNPVGRIDAQISDGDNDVGPGGLRLSQWKVLVHRIDLSYALVPWSGNLGDGRLFTRKYGDRVGYTYYRDEDYGIFWSNDPGKPISRMVKELGLNEDEEDIERVGLIQDRARGKKPE